MNRQWSGTNNQATEWVQANFLGWEETYIHDGQRRDNDINAYLREV